MLDRLKRSRPWGCACVHMCIYKPIFFFFPFQKHTTQLWGRSQQKMLMSSKGLYQNKTEKTPDMTYKTYRALRNVDSEFPPLYPVEWSKDNHVDSIGYADRLKTQYQRPKGGDHYKKAHFGEVEEVPWKSQQSSWRWKWGTASTYGV